MDNKDLQNALFVELESNIAYIKGNYIDAD